MVPISQLTIDKQKDNYIFGVAVTSTDIRKTSNSKNNGAWFSAPFGNASNFFHNRVLIEKRESEKKGFFLIIEWRREQKTLDESIQKITVIFYGEWDKKKRTVEL